MLSALGCSEKPGNSSRSRTGTLMEAGTQIKAKILPPAPCPPLPQQPPGSSAREVSAFTLTRTESPSSCWPQVQCGVPYSMSTSVVLLWLWPLIASWPPELAQPLCLFLSHSQAPLCVARAGSLQEPLRVAQGLCGWSSQTQILSQL